MDSNSFFFDNVKAEKAHAMMRYQRLRRTAGLFRYFFEICLVLSLMLWLSPKLPLTFTIFSDYIRHICLLLKSPRFMFVIGNAIILTLFAKSGQVSGDNNGSDLYDEFVRNSSRMEKIRHENANIISSPVPEVEHIQEVAVSVTAPIAPVVYEDKEIVSVKKQEPNATAKLVLESPAKKYERSRSENMKKVEKPKKVYRRSKTIKSRAEEMSNEEFNRTIEEFIAKQVRFIREESMAIVAQS